MQLLKEFKKCGMQFAALSYTKVISIGRKIQ